MQKPRSASTTPLRQNLITWSLILRGLNNLGSRQFKLEYYSAAELSFEEALTIRRNLPADKENYFVDVYNSLANLALVKVELGMIAIARELYVEALAICEEEVHRNPDRMGDLIRLQWRMCLCLSKIPGAEGEMKHFARLTVESFDTFLKANPDGAAAYAEFGKEASRVSGGG